MRVTIVLPFHFFFHDCFPFKVVKCIRLGTVLQYLGRITSIYTSFYTKWANNFLQDKRYRNRNRKNVYVFFLSFLSVVFFAFSPCICTHILCLIIKYFWAHDADQLLDWRRMCAAYLLNVIYYFSFVLFCLPTLEHFFCCSK